MGYKHPMDLSRVMEISYNWIVVMLHNSDLPKIIVYIPRLGRSPGEENDKLLQYSCLENIMDRGAHELHFMGSQRVRHN